METQIIDSYDRLPLGIYERICDMYQDGGMEDIDRQIAVIALLTGLSQEQVEQVPIQRYQEWASASLFLTREPEKYPRPRKSYRVGRFTLIPVKDMKEMLTAQYIDYQTFAKMKDGSHIAEKLSCLLTPEGERYGSGYYMDEVQQAIREHMSVTDALSVFAFFLRSLRRSIDASLISSAMAVARTRMPLRTRTGLMRRILRIRRTLPANGAGSPASTASARPASANGTRSGR